MFPNWAVTDMRTEDPKLARRGELHWASKKYASQVEPKIPIPSQRATSERASVGAGGCRQRRTTLRNVCAGYLSHGGIHKALRQKPVLRAVIWLRHVKPFSQKKKED